MMASRFWRSFRLRLLIGAAVWILGGMALSGLVLSQMFREHVVAQFDSEIQAHADELAGLIDYTARGKPFLHRPVSDPRFQAPGSGFYWQIEDFNGAEVARSASLGGGRLRLPDNPPPVGEARRIFADGPRGPVRSVEKVAAKTGAPDGLLRVAVGVDEVQLDQVLSRFNRTLALSLGVIGLGLIGAAVLQVWFGLQPLGRVRSALAQVRMGRAARLPEDVPNEVRPLVHELNGLLEANTEVIRRARAQAGNLAHALKTPLAILTDEAERLERAGQAEAAETLRHQCERMRRQIDYQLARARAAASRSTAGAASDTAAVLTPILSAMRRLYAPRGIAFTLRADENVVVAVEAQDLGELTANLIDNAGKWARSTVRVVVERSAADTARIIIDDDGPGLAPESWEIVFDLGQRLDERAPGSGLGLAIVRDLVHLYGGRAWLDAAPLGGLRAIIEIPVVQRHGA